MKEIYTIVKSTNEEHKDRWVRIGAAFVNKDGSINCFLDALPVNGKLHIRDRKEKEENKQDEFPFGG